MLLATLQNNLMLETVWLIVQGMILYICSYTIMSYKTCKDRLTVEKS